MAGAAGPLERAVMDALWDAPGPLRVRELLTELNKGAPKPLAYNTVQTVMERLARKEMLRKTPDGQAFRYGPTRTRDEHAVELMLEVLTDSSDHGAMLARFAESMDPDDARQLFEALRKRTADGSGS